MTPLERRYRVLLRAYPKAYRKERQAELLGVLLDSAPKGQTRPTPRDAIDLTVGGVRTRLRTLPTVTFSGGWCDVAAIAILVGPSSLAAQLLTRGDRSAATIAVATSWFAAAACLVLRRTVLASLLCVCGTGGLLGGLLAGSIDSHAFAGWTPFVLGLTILFVLPSMWARCSQLTGANRRGTLVRAGLSTMGIGWAVGGQYPNVPFLGLAPILLYAFLNVFLKVPSARLSGLWFRLVGALFAIAIGQVLFFLSWLPNRAEGGLALATGTGRAAVGMIMALGLMVWVDGRIQRRWVSWRRQSAPTPT